MNPTRTSLVLPPEKCTEPLRAMLHFSVDAKYGNLNFKVSKLTLKETKIEDYDDFKMIYHGKPYTFIYDDMDLQQIYDKHLQDYKDYLAK